MKKFLTPPHLVILAILLLALSMTCASADSSSAYDCPLCGGENTGDFNSFIEMPTCVSGGIYQLYCNSCKSLYTWDGGNPDPTAHTWKGWQPDGQTGTHSRSCRYCKTTETESCNYDTYQYHNLGGGVYKHGHICLTCAEWVDHEGSGGTATCTSKAVCWCGLTYGDYGDHTPGTPVTTPATCTTDGKVETKCTVCGTVLSTETIPPTDHRMNGWLYSGTPGTHTRSCRNPGCDYTETESCNYDTYQYHNLGGGVYKHGHMCLVCDNWVDHEPSGGTASCVAKAVCWCGLTYGDYGAHTPGTPVTTPATCTTDGKVETKCTVCGTVLSTETIPAPDHRMNGWLYSGTPGTHTRSCRNPGCDYTETESCNYDTYQYHNLGGGVYKHGHMCLVCDNWVDHEPSGGTASCVAKAVCWCGLTYGDVLGHDLDSGVTTPATCTAEGKTVYTCQRPGCTYTKTETIPMLDHVEGDPVIDPEATCCNTGLKSWYCVNCNKLMRTEVIPALGHTAEGSYKWVKVSDPTCTEEGVEKKVCAHSGNDLGETRTTPALGHIYTGLWQIGESDTHYRDCYRCGAGRVIVECDYLPLEIDDVMYQVCPVCGRFHDQELEAISEATIDLATGSKPGSTLVRMLAQPFGEDEVRYPAIMTAIFEAGGRIADPDENVTTMQVTVPLNTAVSFRLVFVSVDDMTGELVWTEVPYTLEDGKLTFTVEELGLFLFVAE